MNDSPETIRFTILGDSLCDGAMSQQLERYLTPDGKSHDFEAVFCHLKPFLDHSDYVCANLETPISRDQSLLTNARWEFCTDASFAEAMKHCGVDYVSTANNHCLDRGLDGLRSTLACLDEIGLAHSGTYMPGSQKKPLIVEVGGVRFGLMSCTYGTNAVTNKQYLPRRYRTAVDLCQEQEGSLTAGDRMVRHIVRKPGDWVERFRNRLHCWLWPQNKKRLWYEWETRNGYRKRLLKKEYLELKEMGADKVVVFLHIGGQYNLEPNSFTMDMTQWFEKLGADFIIANHEHVIHGSRFRNGRLTTYAIGNLLSSSGTIKDPMDRRCDYSIAVHLHLDKATKVCKKVTFSVMKTIYTAEEKFEVWPIADLLPALDKKQQAIVSRDALLAARDFSGKRYEEIAEEFEL